MKKDSNIRVFERDRQLLKKIARVEGRTLKSMLNVALSYYQKENVPLSEQ